MLDVALFREADPALVGDVNIQLWHTEASREPSVMEMAEAALRRFYQSVIEHPAHFQGGMALECIRCLEKLITRIGATLEQLGTNRRLIFKEVRRLLKTVPT
jgi:hypothetical protein